VKEDEWGIEWGFRGVFSDNETRGLVHAFLDFYNCYYSILK